MWTGRWSLHEAILVQSKLTFWQLFLKDWMFCMQLITANDRPLTNRNSGLLRNGLENRDVIEGIVFMKIKYKEAGMEFECFTCSRVSLHTVNHSESLVEQNENVHCGEPVRGVKLAQRWQP